MIEFLPLGGAVEIGANCYYLNINNVGIILDCGMHPQKTGLDSLPKFDLLEDRPTDYVLTHCVYAGLGRLAVRVGADETAFDRDSRAARGRAARRCRSRPRRESRDRTSPRSHRSRTSMRLVKPSPFARSDATDVAVWTAMPAFSNARRAAVAISASSVGRISGSTSTTVTSLPSVR